MSTCAPSSAKWFAALALAACTGCHGPAVRDVNAASGRAAKEWIRDLPVNVDWSVWDRKLDQRQWTFVPESDELRAESLLRTIPYVSLSGDQLAKLAPGKSGTGTPYLVRAVTAAWPTTIRTTAGMEIELSKNDDLWIGGGALSHHAVPIERRALIVWLDRPPKEVYVTFGVAE